MIRFTGAESGATMAMTRLAATMLPNPMLISRGSMRSSVCPASARLLDVLDLLTETFQFTLDSNHRAGDLQVVGLGADGVGLAPHLLEEEFELPSDRAFPRHRLPDLAGVAAQPCQFLCDVAALGEQRQLGRQAGLVQRHLAQQFGQALAQPHSALAHHLHRPPQHLPPQRPRAPVPPTRPRWMPRCTTPRTRSSSGARSRGSRTRTSVNRWFSDRISTLIRPQAVSAAALILSCTTMQRRPCSAGRRALT